MKNKKITIIVPCRNEVKYIETVVSSMLKQESVQYDTEIIIADGCSDDGTQEILKKISADEPRLRVIDNPKKIVSAGLNAAIREAEGNIIIRMDSHTEFARDYIKQCVHILETTGASNVGGPWQAKGKTYLQKAIALAFNSQFSSGGAASHKLGYNGVVDSVYLGCWSRQTLLNLGLFDEDLVRNQDDELNLRLVRSGGTIWQSTSIKSWYYPRASLISLFKQYTQYGYWKVRVIQKHKLPASMRHVVPGMFVGLLAILAIFSMFSKLSLMILSVVFGFYIVVNLLASFLTCKRLTNYKYIPIMPFIFSAFHFGYGYGTIRGVIDFLILKKKSNKAFTKLTRK